MDALPLRAAGIRRSGDRLKGDRLKGEPQRVSIGSIGGVRARQRLAIPPAEDRLKKGVSSSGESGLPSISTSTERLV